MPTPARIEESSDAASLVRPVDVAEQPADRVRFSRKI